MDRGAWQTTAHGVASVRHDLGTKPPPPHPREVFQGEGTATGEGPEVGTLLGGPSGPSEEGGKVWC